jgi:hypothetical protein
LESLEDTVSVSHTSWGNSRVVYLEELIQEGDIVGPFLKGCIEESQDFLYANGIALVVLVLGLGLYSWSAVNKSCRNPESQMTYLRQADSSIEVVWASLCQSSLARQNDGQSQDQEPWQYLSKRASSLGIIVQKDRVHNPIASEAVHSQGVEML